MITSGVWKSGNGRYGKIAVCIDMVGNPREVEVTPQRSMHPVIVEEVDHQKDKRLDTLPITLWSQHDTDVGRVKSASPVEIRFKQGAVPPKRSQYPLKPEAEEGIAATIRGLLEAGVLRKTSSPCNTPLLPVLKADRSKWRLVHDLRTVNEVVEDWLMVVPNPLTYLHRQPGFQ